MGFSINVLSLLGLVLAIGIVVDDAIVVVEAVQVNLAKGMSPGKATTEAMKEVTAPIIATSLVLVAVFIPVASMAGITGRLYQQFAITIAVSVIISQRLVLEPCAVRPVAAQAGADGRSLGSLLQAVQPVFDKSTVAYTDSPASLPAGSPWALFLWPF